MLFHIGNFPYRCSLAMEQLLYEMKTEIFFVYVQCDIQAPDGLTVNFANFLLIFKNTLVSKNDIGDLMKTYAEEEGIVSQPRKLFISSFTLQNGPLVTPLPLFLSESSLVGSRLHRFIEYTPRTCFNSFVQSTVDAGRQKVGNTFSNIVAETMKLLANSFYGYQILDRSRQRVTKYLNDEKTHGAISSGVFKKLNHVNNAFYGVQLAKVVIEHKEPINVGFFILQ